MNWWILSGQGFIGSIMIYNHLSDLGSLILIQMISKEHSLRWVSFSTPPKELRRLKIKQMALLHFYVRPTDFKTKPHKRNCNEISSRWICKYWRNDIIIVVESTLFGHLSAFLWNLKVFYDGKSTNNSRLCVLNGVPMDLVQSLHLGVSTLTLLLKLLVVL